MSNNSESSIKTIFLLEALIIISGLVAIFGSGLMTQAEESSLLQQHLTTEALELTLSTLKDAETGQRGFILTGIEPFLEPYEEAISKIDSRLNELDHLATEKKIPHQLVHEIRRLTNNKLKFMEDSITIRRTQGIDAALAHTQTQAGRIIMDAIRKQVAEQTIKEDSETKMIRQQIDWIIRIRNGIFIFCTATTLAFLGWAYRRLWLEIQRRDAAIADEKEQKELVSVTLASIGDAVIVTNAKGMVTFMNGEAEHTTGWSREMAVGQPLNSIFNIVNEETRKPIESPVAKVLRLGTVVGLANHTALITKDGREIPIDDSGAPIRIGEEIRGVVLVFRDVTVRKEIESQLVRAKNESEKASRAKSNFLANMSHELRTPLTAITGFSELLVSPDLSDDERRQFAVTIRRNGKLLTQIIDDILDLSKVEAEKLVIESVSCSLPAIIADVTSLLGMQAREKGLYLRVLAEGHVPEKIKSDPVRLKQILINIIGNAIKFTSTGGVEVKLKTEHFAESDLKISIWVRDTGRGIGPDQQTRLFQPFMQADESTTRKFGGTGLGLVLSKRLAQALSGDVTLVKSEPGVGSDFMITFRTPQAEGTYQSTTTLSDINDKLLWNIGNKNQLRGVKVLVADDAPDNQMLIRQFLKASGAQVDVAENGKVAVQKAMSGTYDILLMDLLMPLEDGFSATSELRSQGFKKPILAVSAAATRMDRDRALRAGCDEHLTKPLDMSLLVHKMREYLHLS